MNILAFETSCDETAAAVVKDGREILSSVVTSQTSIHARYGGVVPEIAARSHIEVIAGLCERSLCDASVTLRDIDAVAVTVAPGLIGALLVGVNYAKALALSLKKPLIPVHHLRGHIAASYLEYKDLEPPFLAAAVSGGHTQLIAVRGYTDFEIIGTTRDDAAGEVFDKVARVLGLPYPGGVALSRLAEDGNPYAFSLPNCRVDGNGCDMSFSGVKTAAMNILNTASMRGEQISAADLAASFEHAVTEAITERVVLARNLTGLDTCVLCGGVAANKKLREKLLKSLGNQVIIPSVYLCGDNAAMIGAQGYYELREKKVARSDCNGYATFSVNQSFKCIM